MDRRLTDRQRGVLDYVADYVESHRVAPSLAEIGRACGGVSPTAALAHVRALERKGYLRRDRRHPRSLVVLGGGGDTPTPRLLRLSIMGTIAAGRPIAALPDGSEWLWVESSLAQGPDDYVLRVRGNSMVGDGIRDGDLIVVTPQSDARDGETVVALLAEDVATLKRIYRERHRVRLQPANDDLEPIYAAEVTVQGRVVSVIRRYPPV